MATLSSFVDSFKNWKIIRKLINYRLAYLDKQETNKPAETKFQYEYSVYSGFWVFLVLP